MAEEFNPNLQYTSAGLLAMARTVTPSTQFDGVLHHREWHSRQPVYLDYNYTIFGVQTTGSSVVSRLRPCRIKFSEDPNGLGYLQTPVTITSASIFTDTQNGVLELSAPTGVTGTVTVTVTASDGTNTPVTQTFTVTIGADSTSNPANPWAAVDSGRAHRPDLCAAERDQQPRIRRWTTRRPARP